MTTKWLFLVLLCSSLIVQNEAQNGFFSFFNQLGNIFRRNPGASNVGSSSTTRRTTEIFTSGYFGTPFTSYSTGYVTVTDYATITEKETVTETETETADPATVTTTHTETETVTERLIATMTITRKMTATPICPPSASPTAEELRRVSWKEIPNRVQQYAQKPANVIALENSVHYMPYIVKRSIDIESSSSSAED